MRRVLFVLVFVLSGCSSTAQVKVSQPKTVKFFQPNKRCRLVGANKTKGVAVVVRRNCFLNGITSVTILVIDTSKRNRKIVTEQGTRMLISILRFVPQLSLVVAGKVPMQGRKDPGIMYLFVVTGASDYLTLAER